jgi:zinc protease
VLFDRHRIRRWRIGTEAQIAGLSHDDVIGFYRSRYVPERTIIAIAGDADPDAAIRFARDYFDAWPARSGVVDRSPAEPDRRAVRARTLRGDLRRAELVIGWRGVPALHPDAAALDLAAALLGAGRASWLYRALREPGIVTSIGAGHFSPTEVGVFSVAADLDPARLDAALDGVGECVARLREAGPDPEDLARIRRLLQARWARRFERAEGRAAALAESEALGGVHLLEDEYQRILDVDAETVRRVAIARLSADSVAGVAYLPEDTAGELTVDRLRQAFRRPAGRAPPVPAGGGLAVAAAVPVRGALEFGVLHAALPSADLLIRRKPGVPLVSLGVYRRRRVPDTLTTAGLAALAVRSAVRGAGGLDTGALAVAFERLGGALSPMVGADWFGFGTSVLAEGAGEAAALLNLVLQSPRFDQDEVLRERETLAEEAIRVADDMVRYPIQLALRAAFGDRGYGLPAQGFPETVPVLDPALVRERHGAELALGRTAVVAVGDLDPEEFAGRLAGIFGGAPARDAESATAETDGRANTGAPATWAVERSKRQTALAMLFPGPSRTDPSRRSAEIWAAIASGLGGRLFMALREQRSLAYTVMANSWQRAGAGGLLLYLATSPEREEEARAGLLEELAAFRREDVDPTELARAANYLAGQAQVARQTSGAIAGEIVEAWLVGTGLEELEDPAAEFRQVTVEAVRDLAATSLDPYRRAEGVVRGCAVH